MTKEQKIELDKLSTYLNYAKTDNLEEVIVSTKTIETVLNILKEKIAEVEIHTGLEHFYKKEDLDKLELLREANAKIKEKDKEIEKKDKQIDLMLEKINNNYFNIFSGNENNEIRNIYEKNKDTSKLIGRSLRKACIKQYFERKVEE